MNIEDLKFDPANGKTILKPEGKGLGHWIGAPHVYYDDDLKKFFLYVRVRNPRPADNKVAPYDSHRGYKCQILESADGENFKIVWEMRKKQINAKSMEGAALIKIDGKYQLFLSFETQTKFPRWKIKKFVADHPSEFDPNSLERVKWNLRFPTSLSIKDPNIMKYEEKYYLTIDYFRFWRKPWGSTGILESEDGIKYKWLGDMFGQKIKCDWANYMVRITSFFKNNDHFIGFFDGADKFSRLCEEPAGLVSGASFRKMKILSCNQPLFTSEYGTNSVRYFFSIRQDDEIWLYYEYTEKQGEHVLKLYKIK